MSDSLHSSLEQLMRGKIEQVDVNTINANGQGGYNSYGNASAGHAQYKRSDIATKQVNQIMQSVDVTNSTARINTQDIEKPKNANPTSNYQQNAIMTMTPEELLILLYDEAVKKLGQARLLIKLVGNRKENPDYKELLAKYNKVKSEYDDYNAKTLELDEDYIKGARSIQQLHDSKIEQMNDEFDALDDEAYEQSLEARNSRQTEIYKEFTKLNAELKEKTLETYSNSKPHLKLAEYKTTGSFIEFDKLRTSIKNDDKRADEFLDKVVAILAHLTETLDRQYDVSAGLARLYDYFMYTLRMAKSSRNVELIDTIKPQIEELRDSFKTAAETIANTSKGNPEATSAVQKVSKENFKVSEDMEGKRLY